MRVVLQRVLQAKVSVGDKIVGAIDKGLLVLAGFEEGDEDEDIKWMVGKISRLRIFDDSNGVMNLSVTDAQGGLLVVSQFTLHASTKKGNRPSYIKAAHPDSAIPLYEAFIKQLQNETGISVETGVFGAMMQVSLINDGPVTIIIDSRNKE